jgi:hypothetical protein
MAGIFRDVAMEWEGQTYHVTPSNKLLRRIEGQGVNIAATMKGLASGTVSVSSLAFIAAELLKAGGADVTEDQTYGALMGGDEARVNRLATMVAEAIMPKEADAKNPVAPGVPPPTSRATKQAKPRK